jgi:hypothetical protein
VKKLPLLRAALALVAPLLILSFLLYGPIFHSRRLTGLAATSSPTAGPTSANVQVGFITTITGQPPSGLKNVFLNVVAVRLNTKPKSGAKNQSIPNENDANWRAIPVPQGVGLGLSGKPGDLQIDMIAGQGQFQTFNTAPVRPNSYTSVEVLLDTATPGNIVPVCSSGGGAIEGCVNYPIQLQSPGNQISFISSNPIVTAKNTLTQLPLQLNLQIVSKPTSPGAPYIVNVTTAPAPNNASQFLASVAGSVGPASPNFNTKNTVRHLQVSAEEAGTNVIVATSIVNGQGLYSMFLPASADLGTLYDFFVSGGAATYEAARGVPNASGGLVFPGQSYTLNFSKAVGNQTLGTIGGQITDSCTHNPVPGATLEILQAPDGSSVNCATSPPECVSVAFSNTDNGGRYPLPGTFQSPNYFNNVPVTSTNYNVLITAPGYDSSVVQAQASGTTGGTHGGSCPDSNVDEPSCDFALMTSYISGTVTLTGAPPDSNSVDVQVFAEDSGTNHLVSALPVPLLFKSGQSSMNYTINVPSRTPSFDLFASAADLFEGTPDPYPGHTIVALARVPVAPSACATSDAPQFKSMDCTGHASIVGTAINPDSGTTVELSKDGVQLMQSAVGPPAPAPSVGNTYSFCAPPDNMYSVQRLEQGAPAGPTTAVTQMATPMPTNSPCPTTCFNVGNSTCPGLCGTTIQAPL